MLHRAHLAGFPFSLNAGVAVSPALELRSGRAFGSAVANVAVNLQTGNVSITDPTLKIADCGGEIELGFYFNGLTQRWRFTAGRQLRLPVVNNQLTVVEVDGSEVVYQYNAEQQAYVATSGVNSLPVIRFDALKNQYMWFDPATQVTESFDEKGLLAARMNEKGQRTIFLYDLQGNLQSINPEGGKSVYRIDRNAKQIRITVDNVILQTYELNENQQLTASINQDAYRIQYGYTNNGQLKNVVQSDSAQLGFQFGEENKLSQISVGNESSPSVTANLQYQLDQTTLTASNGYQAVLSKQNDGWCFQEPSASMLFNLNAAGQLKEKTAADGGKLRITYQEQTGLPTRRDYPDGSYEVLYYSNDAKPILHTLLHFAKEKSPVAGGKRLIHRERANGIKELCYEITLQGEVTFHEYDTITGLPKASFTYINQCFPTCLDCNAIETLAELDAWRNTLPANIICKQETYQHDERGNCKTISVLLPNAVIRTELKHDLAGRVTEKEIWLNDERKHAEQIKYNANGQILTNILGLDPAIQQVTHSEYAGNTQTITQPNQRVEKKICDESGLLIKETVDEKGKVSRSIDYTRHVSANGMIVKITPRATRSGQVEERKDSFEIYDTEGQLTATVSASGLVTKHLYNQERRYSITKVYADPINVADLNTIPSSLEADFPGYTTKLEAGQLGFALSNRKEPHADQDRETITFFTVNKQPQFVVDAENYLKELRYDTQGHCIAEIRYKIALSQAERADLLAGHGLSRQPNRENARIVSRFYSADGHLKAQQDEAGYVTVHELNAMGWATEKRHYLEPVLDYTEDFAHFKLGTQPSVSGHFSYDALGRPTLHINAEGYATAFQYEAHGEPCRIRHYLKRIKPEARLAPDLTGLAFEDDVITYDELKREKTISYANGRQVTKLYDTMNNVLNVINAEANKTEKTGDTYRETRFEYNLFQEKIAQADPLAMLKIHAQQSTDTDFLWQRLADRQFRDAHGLVTHVQDALGQRTLFYYDDEMRPLVYIDATGGVRECCYNGFGELVTERHYDNRLPSADFNSLKGGLMTAGLKERLERLRSAEDRILRQETDKRGNAVKKWDAENQLTSLTYNAFGECTAEMRPTGEPERYLTVTREHENRGNVISSTESAPDIITRTTKTEYNHYLGLATQIIAPNGGKTRVTRDAVGNIKTVYKATDEKNWYVAEINHWDAFKRPKSTVNADGVEKHYHYENGGRSVVIKTGQHEAMSFYNVFAEECIHDHGAEVQDFYKHDADGGIARTHNALYEASSVDRNVLGDIETHYDAEKGVASFKRNAARQLISERIDPNGLNLETTLQPNAYGEATIKTDARGITTEQQFTLTGKVKKSTIKAREVLPENKLVKATAQKITAQQKKLKNLAVSLQDKSRFAINASKVRITPPAEIDLASTFLHNAFGSVTESIEGDANQPVMRHIKREYNSKNQLIKTIFDPQGLNITEAFAYDAMNNLCKYTDKNQFVSRYYFDLENRPVLDLLPKTQEASYFTQRQFTKAGKLASIRVFANAVNPALITDNKALDAVLKQINPSKEDSITHFCYDEQGLEWAKIEVVYNAKLQAYQGILFTRKRDAAGRVIEERRHENYIPLQNDLPISSEQLQAILDDWANEKIVVTAPYNVPVTETRKAENSADRVLHRFYNEASLETFVIEGNGTAIEYRYDERGRKIMQIEYANAISIPPPKNVVVNPLVDRVTLFVHDAISRETHVVKPNGAVTCKEYDPAHNVISVCEFKKPIELQINGELRPYSDLVKALQTLVPDRAIDTIHQAEFDRLNKLQSTTDPLGYIDFYERNALGHLTVHTDRKGEKWAFGVNAAGYVETSATPKKLVSAVTELPNGQLNLEPGKWRSVVTRSRFNAKGEAIEIIKDDAQEGARKTSYIYNADGNIICESRVIRVDDESKLATKDLTNLPTTLKTIELRTTYNHQGKKIAECDANQQWSYYVYDSAGRLVFEIEQGGKVTGYTLNALNEREQICRYATPFKLDLSAYRTKDIPVDLIEKNLITSDLDRIASLTYDSAGNVQQEQLNAVPFYADGISGKAQPETVYAHNRFGDCVQESRLIRPGVYAHHYRWFNPNGKLLAELNEDNHLTIIERDSFDQEEARTVYALAINFAANASWSIDQLKAVAVPSAKDRRYRFQYSNRQELTHETQVGVVKRAVYLTPKPKMFDLPPADLTKVTEYNPTGAVASITDKASNQTINHLNSCDEVVAEEQPTRLNGETATDGAPIKQSPIVAFAVSAHHERLAGKRYDRQLEDPIPELLDEEIAKLTNLKKPAVIPTSVNADSTHLLYLRQVNDWGNTARQQSAMGDQVAYTYTPTQKTAREITLARSLQKLPNQLAALVTHIDELTLRYDARDNVKSRQLYRNQDLQRATFYQTNVFDENVGEGETPDELALYKSYLPNGKIWNANPGLAPAISFYDLRGLETLILRAPEIALDEIASPSSILSLLDQPTANVLRMQNRYSLGGKLLNQRLPHHFKPGEENAGRFIVPDRWNNPLWEIDCLGGETINEFDDANQLMETQSPIVEMVDEHGVASFGRQIKWFAHNDRSALIGVCDYDGRRDADDNIVPFSGPTTAFAVNEVDLLLATIAADGAVQNRRSYNIADVEFKFTNERGKSWVRDINLQNQVAKLTTPTGKSLDFNINHRGQRLSVTDKAGKRWQYGFDAENNIGLRVLPSGYAFEDTYDRNKKPLRMVNANGNALEFKRDYVGNELVRTDMSGTKTSTDYNLCMQPTAIRSDKPFPRDVARAQRSVCFDYQPDDPLVYFDRIVEAPRPKNQTMAYAYGLLTDIFDQGINRWQHQVMNAAGQRVKVEISELRSGHLIKSIEETYNALGQTISLTNTSDTTVNDKVKVVATYQYDQYNNLRHTHYTVFAPRWSKNCPHTGVLERDEWHKHDERHRLMILGGLFKNGMITCVEGAGTSFTYAEGFRNSETRYYPNQKIVSELFWYDDGRFKGSNAVTNKGVYNVTVLRNDSDWVHNISYVSPERNIQRIAERYQLNPKSHQLERIAPGLDEDGNVTAISVYGTQGEDKAVRIRASTHFNDLIDGTNYARQTNNHDYPVIDKKTEDFTTFQGNDYVATDALHLVKVTGSTFHDHTGTKPVSGILSTDANSRECAKSQASDEKIPEFADAYIENSPEGFALMKLQLPNADGFNMRIWHFLNNTSGNVRGGHSEYRKSGAAFDDITGHIYNGDLYKAESHAVGNGTGVDYVNIRNDYESRGFTEWPDDSNCIPFNWDQGTLPKHGAEFYLTEPGDSFTSIAEKLYGDASAAHSLALYNGYISVHDKLDAGYLLIVPEFLKERLLAGNNNPYHQFQNLMMGAILPHIDMVKYKPHVRSTWFKVLVKAVLLAAVIAISGGMASGFAGLIGIDAKLAFAVLAAAGDAGVQAGFMAVGWQDKFSINETFETAVNTLLLGSGSINSITDALERASTLLITTAETQLIEMAAGTRSKFNVGDIVTQVGANLLGSKFNELLSANLPLTESAGVTLIENAASNALTSTATSVIGNTITGNPTDIAATLANSLGNTIGNVAGDNVNAKLQQIRNRYKPAETITTASKPTHSKPSSATSSQAAKNSNSTRAFLERFDADLAAIDARMKEINSELKLVSDSQQGQSQKITPSTVRNLTALEKAKRAGEQIAEGAWHDGKEFAKNTTREIYTRLATGTINERLQFAGEAAENLMMLPAAQNLHPIVSVAKDIKAGRINASMVKAYYAALVDEALHDDNAWSQVKAGGAIARDALVTIGVVRGGVAGFRLGLRRLLASGMFRANVAITENLDVASLHTINEPKIVELNRFHKAARNLPKNAQQNIRILRNWAKSKGWNKVSNMEGGPEKWVGLDSDGLKEIKLIIKPMGSDRSGLDIISSFPRFEARLAKGGRSYINPFTGEIGGRDIGSHVWLENPFLSYAEQKEIAYQANFSEKLNQRGLR